MLSVEKPALEPILERLEHRRPVHAGGFHPDPRDREASQPLAKLREPAESRLEGTGLTLPTTAILARHAHGADHAVAMHVKTSAPLDHNIHPVASF